MFLFYNETNFMPIVCIKIRQQEIERQDKQWQRRRAEFRWSKTIDDLKAKIKTIRTRYASELSKVQNSSRSGAGTDDIYIPKLFWYKQADTFLRSVYVPRKSTSTQVSMMLTIIPLKKIIIKLRNKNSEH